MMGVSARLERRIRRDFEPGSVEPVLTRLSQLARELDESPRISAGAERVQAAIVLKAAGSWKRFEGEITLANQDWRDELMGSGLENEDWPLRLDAELGPANEPGNPFR